jgi:hypothetical protein
MIFILENVYHNNKFSFVKKINIMMKINYNVLIWKHIVIKINIYKMENVYNVFKMNIVVIKWNVKMENVYKHMIL